MSAQATRECGCGCGALVVRRYLPGHDARHKSALLAAATQATSPWAREQAVVEVFAHGWESHLDLAILRTHPVRNTRRQVRIPLSQVERFLVDPTGTHHARHGCPCLTRTAKRLGMVNPITRVATQASITRVDPTPSLLRTLASGFDACPECTIDWTWDEVIETQLTKRASTLDAIDHTTAGWKPKILPPTKRSSLPFTVEADPIPVLLLPLIHSTFPFLLLPTTSVRDLVMEAA